MKDSFAVGQNWRSYKRVANDDKLHPGTAYECITRCNLQFVSILTHEHMVAVWQRLPIYRR